MLVSLVIHFPRYSPPGTEVKLLSLPPSGAQRKQGYAKCIVLARFPYLLLELFIEVPQIVGAELSEVKKQ